MKTSKYSHKNKNSKIIVFDLDGVLLNSKTNMRLAWNFTKKINNLSTPFEKYFENIGTPFINILKKIKINKNQLNIQKSFKEGSLKNINKIRLYPNVRKVLKNLKEKKYLVGILTSKDKKRSLKILKKFKIINFFDFIECPDKMIKGKPFPDHLLKIMKNYSVKPKNVTYVGDMHSDYLTAKRAKVNFIFAKYGYGSVKKTNKIKKIDELLKIF